MRDCWTHSLVGAGGRGWLFPQLVLEPESHITFRCRVSRRIVRRALSDWWIWIIGWVWSGINKHDWCGGVLGREKWGGRKHSIKAARCSLDVGESPTTPHTSQRSYWALSMLCWRCLIRIIAIKSWDITVSHFVRHLKSAFTVALILKIPY
jgi:hypothetical protein